MCVYEFGTHIESVCFPWIPSDGLDVRPNDRYNTRIGCSRVERPDRTVVAPREKHRRLHTIPLHGLHLILMNIKTPQRTTLASLTTHRGIARQIPQLDRAVRRRGRQEVAMRPVPREREDRVDVVRSGGRAVLCFLALLFAGPGGHGDVCGGFVRSPEDHVWVHGFHRVQRPYLNFRLECAYGNIIPELLRGRIGRGFCCW